MLEIGDDRRVRLVRFHPDHDRWFRDGRYDPVACAIRYADGETAPVERVAPHLLMVDGHPHRRILDDGTIVDYPRTTRGTFRGSSIRILLDPAGTFTWEVEGAYGGMVERGGYDLYRGFARLGSWGPARTIALLPGGDLRVGGERFERVA